MLEDFTHLLTKHANFGLKPLSTFLECSKISKSNFQLIPKLFMSRRISKPKNNQKQRKTQFYLDKTPLPQIAYLIFCVFSLVHVFRSSLVLREDGLGCQILLMRSFGPRFSCHDIRLLDFRGVQRDAFAN